ncbi:MAG: MFS transporter [Fimbriiglobus sp.]
MAETVAFLTRATLLGASSFTVMAGAIVAPGLPQLSVLFHEQGRDGDFLAKLVLSFPALAIAICSPISGWFVDRFGSKPLMLAGLMLYAIAGTTGLYLTDAYCILAGRLALGLAVAMVMTSTTTLITGYFHGTERGRFLGLQATAMALGGVVFLPLGGVLAQSFDWRTPFVLYLLSLPVLMLAIRTIHEPEHTHAPLPGEPPVPPTGEYPLLISWRSVVLILAIAFVGMVVFYLGPPQLPFYMKERYSAGPRLASLSVAMITLCAAITSMQFGRLLRRYGPQPLVIAFFVLLGMGFVIVGVASEQWLVWVGLMVAGLGGGLFTPSLSNWLVRIAPPQARGRLTGALISAIFAGQFLSPFIVLPLTMQGGAALAFEVCGGGLAALGIVYMLTRSVASMRRRQRLQLA